MPLHQKAKFGNAERNIPVAFTVAEMLKVVPLGKNSAYAAIKNGVIPSIRIGRKILIPRRALEKMFDLDSTAA